MALEDLRAFSFLNVPDAHRSICGSRYQCVALILKRPHAALMALKPISKRSSFRIIDIDVGIVTPSENFVSIKLKTSNDMPLMRTECNVFRSRVFFHPALPNEMVSLVQGFVEVHAS